MWVEAEEAVDKRLERLHRAKQAVENGSEARGEIGKGGRPGSLSKRKEGSSNIAL